MSHHHNDDHGASEHAGQPGLLWKIGLFDASHRVFLHCRGHGGKLWTRTLLREYIDDIAVNGPAADQWVENVFTRGVLHIRGIRGCSGS